MLCRQKILIRRFTWLSRCLSLSLFCLFLVPIDAQNTSSSILITESFSNQPLNEVLNLLKEKYQVNFAYDHQAIANEWISCDIKDQNLDESLAIIFANSDLVYKRQGDNQVLVRKQTVKKEEVLELLTIRGQIIDDETGSPLAYAAVYLPGQKRGTVTDEDGRFELQCSQPESGEKLRVQYLGYEPKDVILGETGVLDIPPIELKLATQEIGSITVVETLPPVSLNQVDGGTKIRVDKLATLPDFATGQDIIRNLQLLPGVDATDDLSTGLRVRGSAGDENMMLLDGITLYNVNHFFGVFSLLNPNVIEEATFYKNAFPVEYGGRNASVLDIQSNRLFEENGTPTHTKITGDVTLNVMTSEAHVKIPIGNKMGLLLGGRTTNFDITRLPIFGQVNTENPLSVNEPLNPNQVRRTVVSEQPSFRFFDYNLKWNWQISPKTQLQFAHFYSKDKYDYNYSEEYVFREVNELRLIRETYSELAEWQNSGQSLQVKHQWKIPITTHINASRSVYENRDSLRVLALERRRNARDSVRLFGQNVIDNRIQGTELNIKNTWEISPKSKFTFGYHFVSHDVDTRVRVRARNLIDQSNSGNQHSGYIEWQEKLWNDKLRLTGGLRATHYAPTQTWFYSPRARASLLVGGHLTLKGAFSRYYQFIRQTYHENRFGQSFDFWVLANQNELSESLSRDLFPVSSSTHYMLGFTLRKDYFQLDVEFFQKDNTGVIEHGPNVLGLTGNSIGFTDAFFLLNGKGKSVGVDVVLQKDIRSYSFWLAYTLSKTTNEFELRRTIETFPSKDDRRHQLKWVNQYQLNKWSFALTYIFSSGRPFADVSLINQTTDRNPDLLSRLKDYHRVDLGVKYGFTVGNTQATIGGSIFNLFDRVNVKHQQYLYWIQNNQRNVVGTDVEMLGFTPNLSFSWTF